jgi:predicted RNA binding protein YcfA (HicA-like mRNA interferase family)
MKLPRGVSADRLIRALKQLGYTTVRQKGSHVRLFHQDPPAHSITVPFHNPLKTGTLHNILDSRRSCAGSVDFNRGHYRTSIAGFT